MLQRVLPSIDVKEMCPLILSKSETIYSSISRVKQKKHRMEKYFTHIVTVPACFTCMRCKGMTTVPWLMTSSGRGNSPSIGDTILTVTIETSASVTEMIYFTQGFLPPKKGLAYTG